MYNLIPQKRQKIPLKIYVILFIINLFHKNITLSTTMLSFSSIKPKTLKSYILKIIILDYVFLFFLLLILKIETKHYLHVSCKQQVWINN